MTPRQSILTNLANQLPIANQRLVQQQQAARDIQLQQAMAKLPPAAPVTATAQQVGAVQAQNAGAEAQRSAETALQTNQQIAQVGMQEQQQADRAQLAVQQTGAQQQAMDNVQRLAGISEDAKRQIYDERMAFARDEQGREFLNRRQLDDYAAMSARSDEEFRNYAQTQEQVSSRKIALLETTQRLLEQKLQAEQEIRNQLAAQIESAELTEMEKNHARRIYETKAAETERLLTQLNAVSASIQAEQAEKANSAARIGAIGSVVGAVAGGIAGGILSMGNPLGAAGGAALGAQAGSQLVQGLGSLYSSSRK